MLQGLLHEYMNRTNGLPNLGVKSSYIKEILVMALAFMPQGRIKVKLNMILVAVAHTLKLLFHYRALEIYL